MIKLPYGYKLDDSGSPILDEECAKVVKSIYTLYLAGNSLGKISDILFKQKIPSPSGNVRWTRASIDKLLSNKKYIPHIIPFEQFFMVQGEKGNRSNIDLDSGKRIAKRYTTPVLSSDNPIFNLSNMC